MCHHTLARVNSRSSVPGSQQQFGINNWAGTKLTQLCQCKAGLLVWSRCPRRGKLHFQLDSRHSLPLCLATAIVNWNLAQSGLTASPLSLSGSVFGNGNCQLESRPVRPRLYHNVRQACWSGAGKLHFQLDSHHYLYQ